MRESPSPDLSALSHAQAAYRAGNKTAARHWAAIAASLAPHEEEPWLALAVLASPRASVEYAKRALEINPGSERARKAMRWALRRARALGVRASGLSTAPTLKPSARPKRPAWALATVLFLAVFTCMIAALFWFGPPAIVQAAAAARQFAPLAVAQFQPSATPFPTPVLTFTPTPTASFTPSPTATQEATKTPPPRPSKTPTEAAPWVELPEGVGEDEFWMDVNLTDQTLTAYQGREALRSFLVSTGVWVTPTVTGQYQIYVKYESALMYGPGYYLPDVPYVMYFYKDYGIHGTYWHNNFGTPMSHGCVNLSIEDAGWVFSRSSLGTWVNIHY